MRMKRYEKFDINYAYVQGKVPIWLSTINGDYKVQRFSVGLMSIYNQPNMLKSVLHVMDYLVSYDENGHLGQYSPLNALLDKVQLKHVIRF